ncbi:LexA family protein [Pontibacter russatus]|uniref:LexA family protein n=1 Tax=Pontibacter russatus TaxID=2694929 RepID=UPI00137949AA|nr:translesion error-prone DNA polymerase V autoproteolytic subunit [Pontibacter russatus]
MLKETVLQNRDRSVFGKAFFVDGHEDLELPLFGSKIAAGFPSPATDYIEETINLNRHLIKNPASTFFIRVMGESMQDAYIRNTDLLVIDKSLKARDGSAVVCWLEGEFTVKTYKPAGNKLYLLPANPKYKAIELTEGMDFVFMGVVTYSIHDCLKNQL